MRIAKRITAGLAVVGMLACLSRPMYAQANDPLAAIQQKLEQHIVLAKLDSNGEIIAAGSVATLQKDGLQLCATPNSGAPADAGAPANTYKNGKLSAGMFSWRLGLGISHIDPNSIAQQKLVPGGKFWIVRYNVKKSGVELKLWTDADANNVRYWGWLEFPFAKNQIPPADEVMKTIGEVLAVDTSMQPAPINDATQSGDYATSGQGKYVQRGKSTDFLKLDADAIFVLHQNGKDYKGTYTIDGDTLTLVSPSLRGQITLHFNGNLLKYDGDGTIYEKPSGSASSPAESAPVSDAARSTGAATDPAQGGPQPIPGEYTGAGGSRILLLPDGSFTKFVGSGQVQGKYAIDGDNLTLTFPSTGFSQHFKIQAGKLLDVNTQQVWARTGDAPPPPPPDTAPVAPPTISIGQTKSQVTAAFGEPQRKAAVGPREIFFYTDLKIKVTFTNGKVSSVE